MSILVEKYNYELPENLIALYPATKRDKCRLMMVDVLKKGISHHIFSDIYNMLDENTFLVVNNTKVRNARIYTNKVTGGRSEIFVTNVIDNTHFQGLVRGKFRNGSILIAGDYKFTLLEKDIEGIWFISSSANIENIMDDIGHIPLPPYINRGDNIRDKTDYQTVYAQTSSSSAAPTAGLHFTHELLDKLKQKGIQVVEITLDVGLGTFRPVKTEYMEEHVIHREHFYISEQAAHTINTLKSQGKKLVAVGSTSVRALETATDSNGIIKAGEQFSDIFILEPYRFKVVDNMITNFHLPKSTLLAMVSALGGYELIMEAYKKAIEEQYYFFSYGDAMYIKRV